MHYVVNDSELYSVAAARLIPVEPKVRLHPNSPELAEPRQHSLYYYDSTRDAQWMCNAQRTAELRILHIFDSEQLENQH